MCIMLVSCENTTGKSKSKAQKDSLNKTQLMASIQSLEDSLNTFGKEYSENARSMDKSSRIALETNISVARQEFINRNLTYYKSFPKDSLSVQCLMRVYGLYDEVHDYKFALAYLDTIEINYPDFVFSIQILESKAVSLDYFIEPRDTAKIRVAYERLLDLPQLPPEKQTMYKDRLSNLDKGLEDIIP